jgi:hypothetical protein
MRDYVIGDATLQSRRYSHQHVHSTDAENNQIRAASACRSQNLTARLAVIHRGLWPAPKFSVLRHQVLEMMHCFSNRKFSRFRRLPGLWRWKHVE